jgi:hypothetical protein
MFHYKELERIWEIMDILENGKMNNINKINKKRNYIYIYI